jgi:hypothetical protein
MHERQIHVVFTVPVEETDGEDKLPFVEWLDANIPYGTYEIQGQGLKEASVSPRYKTVKELNHEIRQLALRTLNTLDGLGLGRKGTLWAAWLALAQQDPLDDKIDEALKQKFDQLSALAEILGKALGAIDAFDSAKRDLECVWDGVDRAIENARREAAQAK